MPQRKPVLASGEFYHVFNRTINKEPVFTNSKDCQRFTKTLDYYRFQKPPVKLSRFISFGTNKREDIIKRFSEGSTKLVNVICYCLMPNHFHILLKQNVDKGISSFLALVQNSYTRYFNTKNSRDGHLFKGQFRAVRIEDQDQLLHLNRYIHLNPFSSFVVKTIEDLENYQFSSFPEYIGKKKNELCSTEDIVHNFRNTNEYKKFIFNQADYQRKLKVLEHLTLE